MATGTSGSEHSSGATPRRLGRYTLLKRVARGGMGEVLLAATNGIEGAERPVIVKMIREEHRADASFRARFLDEARVQAQLSHSGVASILDATTDDATQEPYVVVEHVDGKNLGDVRSRALASGAKLDWPECVAVAQMVAEALGHVHDRRDPAGQPLAIVHRDLSPQNVMVAYTGDVKLIDFGTARGQNRRCHTVAGVVFAKPGYVAPEVANGDSGDFRVDLYALGVMLWELCAGRRFLDGEASDHLAAVAAGARDLPPIAESVGARPRLDDVITKLTAFDREERYASSRDAARDLAGLLGDAPALPGGERGVRGRVAALLSRLFPGESSRFRREFARLVEDAHRKLDPASIRATAETVRPQAPGSRPSVPEAAAALEAPDTDPSEAQATAEAVAEPPTEHPAAGALPGTRWRLVREIGRGACSVVWEAEHDDLGTHAAIKVHPGGETGRSRFRTESRALARVEGPVVAQLREAGVSSDGRPFTVLELLEGETLERWALARSPLAVDDALRMGAKLLTALQGIHKAGLVHRDLKPSNVFCLPDGSLRILDLGVALDRNPGAEEDPPSGGALALHGTPAYMAPEQASGIADERSDLYAVGCILYELIAGSLPFEGDGEVGALASKAKGSPEPLRERVATREIPREVDDLVLRALARHPSVRFATAGEMRDAVQHVLTAPQRRRSRRRRIGLGALATAMLASACLFALPHLPQTAGFVARLSGRTLGPTAIEVPSEVAVPSGLDALAARTQEEAEARDPLAALPPAVAEEERALRLLEDEDRATAEREQEVSDALGLRDADGAEGDAELEEPSEEVAEVKPTKRKRARRRETTSTRDRRDQGKRDKADKDKASSSRKKSAPSKDAASKKSSKGGDAKGVKSSKEKRRSKKKGKGSDPAASG